MVAPPFSISSYFQQRDRGRGRLGGRGQGNEHLKTYEDPGPRDASAAFLLRLSTWNLGGTRNRCASRRGKRIRGPTSKRTVVATDQQEAPYDYAAHESERHSLTHQSPPKRERQCAHAPGRTLRRTAGQPWAPAVQQQARRTPMRRGGKRGAQRALASRSWTTLTFPSSTTHFSLEISATKASFSETHMTAPLKSLRALVRAATESLSR